MFIGDITSYKHFQLTISTLTACKFISDEEAERRLNEYRELEEEEERLRNLPPKRTLVVVGNVPGQTKVVPL